MLSIDHPHLLPHLARLRYGIQPVIGPPGTGFFVFKVTKEAILSAQLKNELRIYLLSDGGGPDSHLGVVTAFADDDDEPEIITTALFSGDDMLRDVTTVLSQPEFKVYFFDEHNRELMGARAIHPDVGRFREEIATATFAPFDHDTYLGLANRLQHRFGVRDAADDRAAYILRLADRLYPDDFAIPDARPEGYQVHGAQRRPPIVQLVREDPGPPQERDIALMLGRVFPPDAIYLNPFRADTGKELTDVLVVTDQVMLFIEAKDSPNTAASLERTLERRRHTVQKQIGKATQQLKGGLTHTRAGDGVSILTDAGVQMLALDGRQLLGLVVIREMFDHDQVANSKPVLDLIDAIQLPIMLIDYPGLHVISLNLRTPAAFLSALHDVFDMAMEHRRFPRSVWNGPPADDPA